MDTHTKQHFLPVFKVNTVTEKCVYVQCTVSLVQITSDFLTVNTQYLLDIGNCTINTTTNNANISLHLQAADNNSW